MPATEQYLSGVENGRMELFVPITRVDEEKREFEGYAFVNEVVEGEGGICLERAAMEEATPDYLKWGALREMHQPKAAGTAVSVRWDEKGAHFVGRVIDPIAWEKVKEGVYKGLSVGVNPVHVLNNRVKRCRWPEVSLVDRPKDHGAVITLWRADGIEPEQRAQTSDTVPSRENLEPKGDTHYDCGMADGFCHGHTTRGGAVECRDKTQAQKEAYISDLEDHLATMKARRVMEIADTAEEIPIERAYPNEHAARQRDPGDFDPDSFRRKEVTDGISFILGKLKDDGDSMVVQSVRFDKDDFTPERARAWLKAHKMKADLEAARGDDQRLEEAAERRIAEKEGAPKSPPEGYPKDRDQYADPANYKYPIDTKEHVRAAWAYINQEKNQKQYTPEELATVKARIKRAAKKFGVDISEERAEEAEDTEMDITPIVERLDATVERLAAIEARLPAPVAEAELTEGGTAPEGSDLLKRLETAESGRAAADAKIARLEERLAQVEKQPAAGPAPVRYPAAVERDFPGNGAKADTAALRAEKKALLERAKPGRPEMEVQADYYRMCEIERLLAAA